MKILPKQDVMYVQIISNDKKSSKSIRIEWQDPIVLAREIKDLMGPISDQWSEKKSTIRIQENISSKGMKYMFSINIGADVDTIYDRFITN